MWEELQRQLDAKGLKVKKGVVQDATFITSDPGHAKADQPRGEEARTRRSRDGSWTKKGSRSYYGFKLHAKMDVDYGLIRDLETTPANVHDSRVDLSREGEVVYRDKGYFGVEPRGYDATMRRGVRGHPGPPQEQEDQQEAGSWGAPVRCDQACVQRGACAVDYGGAGSREDGVFVFLL